ncbi:MAG: hypothetical protein AAB524_01060 [Patescibacteria group bacterium]
MKIFEFQFNPKAKKDRFFRVFSFDPPQEMQQSGSMYIVGELQNALPNNSTFLDRLASLLSQEYYSAEKPAQNVSLRLKNALKKGNAFLAEESKNGNVDWLGNLHFLLLLFVPTSQGYTLYFTKVGALKLWIARAGSLVDAGKSIESAKKDESSTKVLGNMGSGKVISGDKIMALTAEAFEFFSKENFLQTLAQLKEEKQFKSIFKLKQKEMSLFSGVLFFALVETLQQTPASPDGKQGRLALLRGRLAIPQLKIPLFPAKISLPSLSVPRKIPLPRISFPYVSALKKKLPLLMISEAKKRMGLLLLLCFVLFLGFALLGGERKNMDDTSLPAGGLEEEEISEELRVLHKITEIAEPEVVVKLNPSITVANLSHMIQLKSRFYFFGPSSSNIFVFDSAANTSEIFDAGKNLKLGVRFEDSILFFAEPNTILSIDGQNTIIQHTLESFAAEEKIADLEQFAGNFYFLDSRNGEIFKSSQPSLRTAKFERWLDPLSPKKPIDVQSMSIDGNIWILTTENEIQRYFRGRYQESLNLSIFPEFQNATLIKTTSQLPYLYVLEPQEQRLVILSKSGEVLRQYRSQAFGQVRDFAVSPNGQTIYLFDGAKVYQISPVKLKST